MLCSSRTCDRLRLLERNGRFRTCKLLLKQFLYRAMHPSKCPYHPPRTSALFFFFWGGGARGATLIVAFTFFTPKFWEGGRELQMIFCQSDSSARVVSTLIGSGTLEP